MNIEERVDAMRAGRALKMQAAPTQKKVTSEQATPEAAVEALPSTEKDFDIANNTVAKLMNRNDLSDKGKLDAVVEFLCARDDDFHSAQSHFAELEVYFTYEQSKRTQVSEQNIQRLIDELEEGTKLMVAHIISDFNSVNVGAGKIKQLLTVMEKARVDGRTVEVLTAAYKYNERLIKEIATLKNALAEGQTKEAETQKMQKRLQDQKVESQKGAVNQLFRLLGLNESTDRIADALFYANYNLKTLQGKIRELHDNLVEREGKRSRELEDGDLAILRTIDATEGGLTDQILETRRTAWRLSRVPGLRLRD